MRTATAVFLRAGCVTGSSTAPTALMKRQPYVSPSTKHITPFIHFLSLFILFILYIYLFNLFILNGLLKKTTNITFIMYFCIE